MLPIAFTGNSSITKHTAQYVLKTIQHNHRGAQCYQHGIFSELQMHSVTIQHTGFSITEV